MGHTGYKTGREIQSISNIFLIFQFSMQKCWWPNCEVPTSGDPRIVKYITLIKSIAFYVGFYLYHFLDLKFFRFIFCSSRKAKFYGIF